MCEDLRHHDLEELSNGLALRSLPQRAGRGQKEDMAGAVPTEEVTWHLRIALERLQRLCQERVKLEVDIMNY